MNARPSDDDFDDPFVAWNEVDRCPGCGDQLRASQVDYAPNKGLCDICARHDPDTELALVESEQALARAIAPQRLFSQVLGRFVKP